MNYREFGLDNYIPGCSHFVWHEAIFLRSWSIHCWPQNEDHFISLIKTFRAMERVRDLLGARPLSIISGYRPSQYNAFVKGSANSAHQEGKGCDFSHPLMKADQVREVLLPYLDTLKIRMEDLPESSWIHIDIKDPGPSGRFFKP